MKAWAVRIVCVSLTLCALLLVSTSWTGPHFGLCEQDRAAAH
ncbi:hypothetical protein RAS12_26570 [Achromobacter seleniivolatilans]|uniref:Uncharacterized protein n=1 Tax=Achromobacter seleniivolatilans TaxID=3047478 RepID=A0ABY9LZE1_9BURK|nr:hypothetical protein [Achromobacter sp. R39]WMD20136.1 hypothetical protein RAS12_26570 [Achromobacter sp. R39]